MKIHQFLPSYHPGDAIGNETKIIQIILKQKGYDSDVYCEYNHSSLSAYHYLEYSSKSSKENIIIYHHSIGSPIADFIKDLPDKKILIYHNITPPHYFRGINNEMVLNLEKGREELRLFAQNFDIALGDSEYNRYELEQMGYPNTGVLPLLIDYSIYTSWNHDLCNTYSDDWVNILFVGRISPNKKHEDIIKVFYYYKKIKPKSRLFLPGGYGGCEPYFHSLQTLVQDLQLSDVHFPGKVPIEDLVSYYQVSDIFLCMSEHEGFNVPLVESMYFGVPIIAYNACAIPHTLGDAGILVKSKSYIEIAELINLIVEDQAIRERLISRQRERLKAFDYSKIAAEFYAIIKRFELE